MHAAAIASSEAAMLFLVARPCGILLIPAVTLIVCGAMLLLSWGPKASSVAFATALSLVFAMSLPMTPGLPWDRIGWGLLGLAGYWIWAMATARLLQPTWRNLVLAGVAEGLSKLLGDIARRSGNPPTRVGSRAFSTTNHRSWSGCSSLATSSSATTPDRARTARPNSSSALSI